MTAIYSILHMLVDGICALAMFGNFVNGRDGQFYFLIYNFCAFALQMPLGVLLDMMNLWYKDKKTNFSFVFAMVGVVFTILGAMIHPIMLGFGNAMFHIGGGVGTTNEDEARGWKGRGLGVFVAPGAFGLYLGTILAKKGIWSVSFAVGVCLTLASTVGAAVIHKKRGLCVGIDAQNGGKEVDKKFCKGVSKEGKEVSDGEVTALTKGGMVLGVSCLLIVILRSYIGMSVAFPWKQVPLLSLISVLAIVCGKVAGGFLAVKFGYKGTVILTLGLAAVGYLGLEWAPMGIMALFAFNMTMPMTLYLLIKTLPKLPGFSFGLLTFGLFLGFLPAYFGIQATLNGQVTGCLGSILSMMILLVGIRQGGKNEPVSD